jgi:tRNA pseudouridine13 synthase
MKLRRLAEDFRVAEQNSLALKPAGQFAAYELVKSRWTTLEAIERLSRLLNIPRRDFSHAGLKDRHAITSQLITIRNGPPRSIDDDALSLVYRGQASRATTASDITGNSFELVLRSLLPAEVMAATRALSEIRNCGIANYFDDQRFGSYFPERGFIAGAWIREDYELALRLAFAEHQPFDDAEERQQKEILRDHWGDWPTCKQLLNRSHRRSIITFLCDHPTDFKKAWGTVNAELRGLFLSALQSDLWNRLASALFLDRCRRDQLSSMALKTGPLWFPRQLDVPQLQDLREMQLPLPSARLRGQDPLTNWIDQSLSQWGWPLKDLKVRYPRDRFFSRSRRPVLISATDLHAEFSTDELDSSRQKLALRFSLPRGAYATMLVKRLGISEQVDLS